jgi:ubiquinone/menaquinone biosynthesis C-methylase UbiE
MTVRSEFDAWAAAGRDKGMEARHWHTAKEALARMPVGAGETVLDLGTGSGYALRALSDAVDVGRGVGLDASGEMVRNAREYTDDPAIEYVVGDFQHLPFPADSVDHVWSMEAVYYARRPSEAFREVRRVLRPGGTFYCAVDFFAESTHTRDWQDRVGAEMHRWDRERYREAVRSAGLHVAAQETIPNRAIDIPPAEAFPTDDWERRADMVDRYRTWGTLLTVGVAP